jgi:hypothetical protein
LTRRGQERVRKKYIYIKESEKKYIYIYLAGHWWLRPVVLVTWEAEIRRIEV